MLPATNGSHFFRADRILFADGSSAVCRNASLRLGLRRWLNIVVAGWGTLVGPAHAWKECRFQPATLSPDRGLGRLVSGDKYQHEPQQTVKNRRPSLTINYPTTLRENENATAPS